MDVLTPLDDGYPFRFGDLPFAPPCLYVQGEVPSLDRVVSIVGTRSADDEAMDFTRRLSRSLAEAGATIVSGGARGIDAAAHEGALAGGGPTIVVLPIGLDQLYPAEHRGLFERVSRSGCLLTEVDPGAPIQKGRFLARNRLIAALGDAVVVVQAPSRSGALSTARHASRLGRAVFVVPASPWDPRGSGVLALLRGGARICVGPDDVLSGSASALAKNGSPGGEEGQDPTDFSDLSPIDRQILEALGGRPRHPDELCARTGIPAVRVQQSMLALLVRGLVEERPGGRFKSCRARNGSY